MSKLKKYSLTICLALCLAVTCCVLTVFNAYAGEDANSVSVNSNFGTMSSLSSETAIVESAGVSVGNSTDHGAIPSNAWGDPFLIADESYLIYEIKATDAGANQVFETLKLNLNARVWNQDNGTAHAENAINVYIGTSPATATTLVKSYNPDKGTNTGANFADLAELDLSDSVANYSVAYIKIELKQSKNANCGQAKDSHNHSNCGTVASSDGYIEIGNAGIKLNTVSLSATTKEGTAVATPDYTLSSDFTANKIDACNVYDKKGVASDGNEHGLVPAEAWGGWVKIPDESYVVYKLDADKGKAFDSLNLSLTAKLWNQNDGDCHENNKIKVYLSADGTNWTNAVVTYGCSDADGSALLTVSDKAMPYISDASYKTVYVKIELVQYKSACGQHMYNGGSGNFGEHHGSCGSGKTTADGYMELWHIGVKLYTVEFEGTYKDIPVVTVNYNDGETTLYTDEYQDKGGTLNGYTPAEKENYEFKGWFLDKGCTNALPDDYTASENVTLYAKYSLIEYKINYVLDGGTNASANPEKYTHQDEITLAAPTREGFEFKGWYDNANFEGKAVTTISGSTKQEIVLYAKWQENVTPPVDDNPSEDNGNGNGGGNDNVENNEKGGCSSQLNGFVCVLGGAVILGTAVVLFKKKEKTNG